jgi:DNA-binding CsgD family transcriptional regulator
MSNPIAEEILMHIGIKKRSGRYPYGSGDNPYQHSGDFLSRVEELKKQGWEETPENIKNEFGMSTTEYRSEKAIAKNARRQLNVDRAKSLKEDGLNTSEIARKMGVNESTVRSWFDTESENRMKQAEKTANFLKEQVKEKGMIDVGAGVERELNISKEKLNQALNILEGEGYHIYGGRVEQVTNKGKQTTLKVLCPPGTEHKEIYNFDKINTIKDYVSHDGGDTYDKYVYPKSMDSKRLMIRYRDDVGPDGARGVDKDGIIEIRRGVEDLSLGNKHYAQVRMLVDNDRYIKGMAVYSDDLPDGVDVIFNTNKTPDVAKMDVLKKIKDDPDNPFGSLIKAGGQSYYTDKDGNRQLSVINKTREEGDWDDWKDRLPSQFLSKQSLQMAKKQLNLAVVDKEAEYDEICSLTNPTVKKHLLQSFADDCDKSAVHLQAAALPGQKYHVIIPVNSLKDNEVYAPGYESGTKLALIRYPHGGTFEIPILTVNNKNKVGRTVIGEQPIDAVGINSKNAERLSGADFDGDTVMCIPTHDKGGKVKITSTPPLKGLEGFDPKTAYPEREGMKYMKNTGTQMGIVSNLITDMTLKGATQDELARAVRHSMVVIDAEKHKLDYKQSELDNGIAALKKKYQSGYDADGKYHSGGASTLISRAKSEVSVDKRQGTPKVNTKGKEWYDPSRPEGSLIYKTADDLEYTVKKVNKRTGEETVVVKTKKQQSTKMAETDDAYSLVSEVNTPMERAYAEYANKMKSMANQARKEMVSTGKVAYSSSAKSAYQKEVYSLMDKLRTAELNAPRERRAQLLANTEVNAKKQANPDMKPGDIKKAGQQALTKYRNSVSAKRQAIVISDKEWEAIQAGAVSENTLVKILKNTDVDNLRQRATPRATTTLSPAKISKIKAMSASNYTIQEIAKALGVSTSTVSNNL